MWWCRAFYTGAYISLIKIFSIYTADQKLSAVGVLLLGTSTFFFFFFFSPFGQIQLHTYYDVGAAIVDGDVVLCNKLLSCARLSWCIKATSFLFSFLLGFVSFFLCVSGKKKGRLGLRGAVARRELLYIQNAAVMRVPPLLEPPPPPSPLLIPTI